MIYPSGTGASPVLISAFGLHGRGAHATNTPPVSTYSSNCFVGKYPSALPYFFCSESMNGTSASVAGRTDTEHHGIGMIALDIMILPTICNLQFAIFNLQLCPIANCK